VRAQGEGEGDMSRADIFSSTTRPPPTGTLAQVRHYWRETWPEAMSRAFPAARQSAAREMYSYLPSSAPSPFRGGRGVGVVGTARYSMGELGTFFDPAQQERGAISPLEALFPGGVAK